MKRLARNHLAHRLARIHAIVEDRATFKHGVRQIDMFSMFDVLKGSAKAAKIGWFRWNLNFDAVMEIHQFLEQVERDLTALTDEEAASFHQRNPLNHEVWVARRDAIITLRAKLKQTVETCRTHSRYAVCQEHLDEIIAALEAEGV